MRRVKSELTILTAIKCFRRWVGSIYIQFFNFVYDL